MVTSDSGQMSAHQGFNYGQLMQRAMRSLMVDVLNNVAANGLPGDHHFYICFDTRHPGVDIPDWLREKYPHEMTIVLQEWFDDLTVASDRFSVTLNFSDHAETLAVPLAAVRTFVDPSVKFGLKFDEHDPEDDLDALDFDEVAASEAAFADDEDDGDDEVDVADGEKVGADIVSLDKFRKT